MYGSTEKSDGQRTNGSVPLCVICDSKSSSLLLSFFNVQGIQSLSLFHPATTTLVCCYEAALSIAYMPTPPQSSLPLSLIMFLALDIVGDSRDLFQLHISMLRRITCNILLFRIGLHNLIFFKKKEWLCEKVEYNKYTSTKGD